MKAIVLAGGYATRLWPITKRRPKMFLPLGETTVIDRIFADLEADDRITDVFVSTNERFADSFRTHIAEKGFEKARVSVEASTAEDEKYGVVGALHRLVERECIAEETAVVAGDNLISFDIGEFLDFFVEQNGPALAAYDVESKKRAKSYGLVEIEGETVVDFQEKPQQPDSTLVSIACYGFTPDVLELLSQYLDSGNNPDEPGWFIQWLQNRTAVSAFTFDEAWFDIGTAASYLDAVEWYLDGDAVVAESASLENAEIGENVHIMANAEVTNATVEKSIIFPNATVEDCSIHASIVDRESLVSGIDLTNDLIGANSRIQTGATSANDRRLTVVRASDGGR